MLLFFVGEVWEHAGPYVCWRGGGEQRRGGLRSLVPLRLSPSHADSPPPLCRLCPPAVGDALKSIRLFKLYQSLQADQQQWQAAQHALLATPPAPSFARQNPSFEGVCMGNRKTCTCGAAFLG